jgi:hypothetical protein
VTAHDVVRALRARGVAVEVHGERLRVAPADRVSPAELDALRTRKADVLALLRAEAGVPAPPGRSPTSTARSTRRSRPSAATPTTRSASAGAGSDAPAATFPRPGCGRALPVARSRDPDFTVCVCCKLDEIERRLR